MEIGILDRNMVESFVGVGLRGLLYEKECNSVRGVVGR